MKVYGRRVVETLAIGGTIVAGVAFNSNVAMAAEEETDLVAKDMGDDVATENQENNQIEIVENAEIQSDSVDNITTTDETISKMEDALGVVEGDALAEEGYIKQAEELATNDDMDLEKVDEFAKNGLEVYQQAWEKNEVVKAGHEESVKKNDDAKTEFYNKADENNHYEDVEKCEEQKDNQSKIEVLTDIEKQASDEYENFVEAHGEGSEEYQSLTEEISNGSVGIEEAEKEYTEAEEQYNKVVEETEADYSKYQGILDKGQEYVTKYEELWEVVYYREYRGDYFDAEVCKNTVEDLETKINEVNRQMQDSEKRQNDYLKKLEENEDETVRNSYNSEVESYNTLKESYDSYLVEKEKADADYTAALAKADAAYAKYLEQKDEFEKLQVEWDEWQKEVNYNPEELSAKLDEIDAKRLPKKQLKESAESNLNTKKEAFNVAQNRKSEIDTAISSREDYVKAVRLYKTTLQNTMITRSLLERSNGAYEKTGESYKKLNDVLASTAIDLIEKAAVTTEEDAVIEKDCVKKAKEAIESGSLDADTIAELLDVGKTVLQQAQSKNDELKGMNEKVSLQKNEVEKEFSQVLEMLDRSDIVSKVMETEGDDEKINVIDEVVEEADAEYLEFVNNHGESSSEYGLIVSKLDEATSGAISAEKEYNAKKSKFDADKSVIGKYSALYNDYYETYDYDSKLSGRRFFVKSALSSMERYAEDIEKYGRDYKYVTGKTAGELYDNAKKNYEDALGELSSLEEEIAEWKKAVLYDEIEAEAIEAKEGIESLEVDVNDTYNSMIQKAAEVIGLQSEKKEADKTIKNTKETYEKFSNALAQYKQLLQYSRLVQAMSTRAEAGLADAKESYKELQKIVIETVEKPVESFSRKVSQKIENIYDGYTAYAEGIVTVTPDVVTKTAESNNVNSASFHARVIVNVLDGNKLVDTYLEEKNLPMECREGKWMVLYGDEAFEFASILV